MSVASSSAAQVAVWRERILHVTVVILAVLAVIAYVPGVVAAARAGLWSLVVVDTVAWLGVVALAVGRRRIPYRVRAVAFLGIWYLLSVVLLVLVGPVGGGAVWLMGFPVVGAVLLGMRGTVVALAFTALTLLALAGLIAVEGPGMADPETGLGYELLSWLATAGSVFILGALLALSVAVLVQSLEGALAGSTAARAELAQANRQLEEGMAERDRLQAQLVQSQKLEALGTLAGGIAHDFNNLLVPILVQAQEVRDGLPEPHPHRDPLDEVLRSARRARDLVRRILAFSRPASEGRRPAAVDEAVQEVADLLRGTVPASVRIEGEVRAPGARVTADSAELHQILMNLATNGYLAMKKTGGVLTLLVERNTAAGMVVFQVRDTGEGMPAGVLRRAFDPFFTTRPPGQGTGLGLATVHALVTSLGGAVHIESEPGRGTTVELRLPEAAAEEGGSAAPSRHHAAAEDAPASLPRGKVLVVDDEAPVRRAARLHLERMGWQVSEAADPEAALRQVEEDPASVDLVLTDQAMPHMTGLTLARKLLDIRPDVPIVLTSGFLDQEALRLAEEVGVRGILEKPFDREGLERVVREATRDPDRPSDQNTD